MIYFFYGDEDYNIDLEVEKLKSQLDPNFLEMSFKKYDTSKDKIGFADLISILRTQPMMFGKMLIVLDCIDIFSKTFEDKEFEQIEDAIEGNTDSVDIVFVAKIPRDDDRKKLDSRRKLFKLLSKKNAREFPSIPTYKPELSQWIKNQGKTYGITLSENATETLIAQLGNNLRQLDSEIKKLSISIYPKTSADENDVREICTNNDDLFALFDALMKMDFGNAVLEYYRLTDKNHPIKILASLQTMVRKWIILKSKSKLPPFELMKLTGMKEYPIQLSLGKMKNTTLKELANLKRNLTNIEYKIKSGQCLDVEREVADAFFVR